MSWIMRHIVLVTEAILLTAATVSYASKIGTNYVYIGLTVLAIVVAIVSHYL